MSALDDARRQRLHGDAVLDRTNIDAQIAADALLLDHLEMPDAVDHVGDRLVRGVLAGDMAAPAFNARILVDTCLGDIVEVEILPVRDVRRGAPDDIVERMRDVRERCQAEGRDPATLRFSLYERDELMREAGQPRVDRLARMQEIGLDRLIAFPTRWSPTLEAQAAFATDCRAAGISLSAPLEPVRA